MSLSKDPGQSSSSNPVSLDTIAAMVARHTHQLSQLNSELTQAFTSLSLEIRAMKASAQNTAMALNHLTGLVTQLSQAPTPAQPGPDPVPALNTSPPPPNPVAAPSAPPPSDPRLEPNLPCPKPFGGEFGQCRGFLGQCELLFQFQPSRYASGGARVALVMSLLSDRALTWAIAATGSDPGLMSDYPAFLQEFRLVFDHPTDGPDAASRLHSISQGTRSVADYSLEFRTLAADSTWDDAALRSAYRRGLSEAVKDLLIRDRPSTLSELISLSLLMDDRLRERRLERTQRPGGAPKPQVTRPASGGAPRETSSLAASISPLRSFLPRDEEEPMELARSRLSSEERDQRMRDRLCLYCGKPGHHIRACPTRPKDQAH